MNMYMEEIYVNYAGIFPGKKKATLSGLFLRYFCLQNIFNPVKLDGSEKQSLIYIKIVMVKFQFI